MKTRKGFVANSSSSSFVVATKKPMDKEMLKKAVIKAAKIAKDSPFRYWAERMAEIMAQAELVNKEYAEDQGYENLVEYLADNDTGDVADAIKKGYKYVYHGWASDQDEPEEYLLCMTELDYADDDILIKSEGGY